MTERINTGLISDGYHTFNELYEHRHALMLALMKAVPQHSWFSRRHHDGELCFGDGEWFIVGAELPESGAVTYHLPMRLWGLAELTGAAELERGRPWDGHTANDVVHRLKAWASCPESQYTKEEIEEFTRMFHARKDSSSPEWDGTVRSSKDIEPRLLLLENKIKEYKDEINQLRQGRSRISSLQTG